MSEITQQPQEVTATDTQSRINRIGASEDHGTSNKQSTEQQHPGSEKHPSDQGIEKQPSHHDPAVTLASTLSKLDAGSYFVAQVTGKDADGRYVIASDIGTYLIEATNTHMKDVQRIPADAQIELRVSSIGREITADIIRPPIPDSESFKPNIIPVKLLLTELAHPLDNEALQTQATANRIGNPIDDVKSQYQAATLFKAERIARDISDKMDNLPLPTTSPNYTIFGASPEGNLSSIPAPKQVSANIFVQEVKKPSPPNIKSSPSVPHVELGQILGQTVKAEIIKAVPKTPTPLPAGLPISVVKEINANTPLDYVTVGQTVNINIAAVAIPDSDDHTIALEKPDQNIGKTNTLQNVIMSGIIIENGQNPKTGNDQKKESEYLLATPTAVMKFKSETTLVPGTIVSFTIATKDDTPNKTELQKAPLNKTETTTQDNVTAQSNTPTAIENAPSNVISPDLIKQIEFLNPQPLDKLMEDWQSLSMAASALTTTNSTTASQMLMSRIPNIQTPEQFTATMFFFLSAIKAPKPAPVWLGNDVTSRLQQIKAGKIIEKVNNDLTRIAQVGSDIPSTEWRPYLIPVQIGSDINAIPILIKALSGNDDEQNQKDQNQDDNKHSNAKRFILEIKMSQFGVMTIDGMLREERLDIILKSKKQIPFTSKMTLSREFSEALHKSGFEGELVIIDQAPDETSVSKIVTHMMGSNA